VAFLPVKEKFDWDCSKMKIKRQATTPEEGEKGRRRFKKKKNRQAENVKKVYFISPMLQVRKKERSTFKKAEGSARGRTEVGVNTGGGKGEYKGNTHMLLGLTF